VNSCPICSEPVPYRHGRIYCSVKCRKTAERQRLREKRAAEFVAAYEAAYSPMVTGIGTMSEVRQLLMTAARLGSVEAARVLLAEFRREGAEDSGNASIIDELAKRRNR
jgi:hypothetical protein